MKHFCVLLTLLLTATLYSCSNEESQESRVARVALGTDLEKIRDDFLANIKDQGFQVPYTLLMVISSKSDLLMSFSGNDKKGIVFAPFWQEVNQGVRTQFEKWAKGSNSTAEEAFILNFNWFLVIHELGHYIQAVKARKLTFYEAELEANKIAIAYWREKGEGAKVDKLIELVKVMRSNMNAPKDLSKEYFNKNYTSFNTESYGYFQFLFYEMAAKEDLKLKDFL